MSLRQHPPQPSKKNNPTHTSTQAPRTIPPVLYTQKQTMTTPTTTTSASLVPNATSMPTSPDQKPNLQSQFKASIPAIIFTTCTIGGVFLIILIGILLVKLSKKGKERQQQQQEHHQQWLARQNLEREETRVERMAFGGWFGRADDGSLPGARTRMSYAEQTGMELGQMQKGRQSD